MGRGRKGWGKDLVRDFTRKRGSVIGVEKSQQQRIGKRINRYEQEIWRRPATEGEGKIHRAMVGRPLGSFRKSFDALENREKSNLTRRKIGT